MRLPGHRLLELPIACSFAPRRESPLVSTPSIRIAAIADLHVRTQADVLALRDAFANLDADADLLLIAGDLTEMGRVAEMELVAELLGTVALPTFVTLGNHDRRGMRRSALTKVLRSVGAIVLDGTGAIAKLADGTTVGIAGVTGTGGKFRPEDEEFGPGARFTRALLVKSRRESARLRKVLRQLQAQEPDILIVLSHFAPTISTLGEEPPLKYWMLGNALLGETIDAFAPHLVVHGHAHLGNERGATEAGVPVLNVALPVVGGIRLLELGADGTLAETGLRRIESPLTASRVRASDVR